MEDRRGQVFENPVSGERAVVLVDPEQHPERVLVSHLYVAPGGRVAAARGFRDTLVITSPPPWVQALVFGALAPIGRLAGRRPSYERYLTSEVVVEPEPEALSLLTPAGRLRFGSASSR